MMLIKNFTAKFPFLIMWMIITRLTEQAILIFCVAAEQLISPLKATIGFLMHSWVIKVLIHLNLFDISYKI